jgi:hypothetical protein
MTAHAYDDPDTVSGAVDPQPTSHELAAARAELGACASHEDVYDRACELMRDSLELLDLNADDHAADNYAERWT